jgi:hypothetical protein
VNPCQESRVESSLRSSFGSSLKDRWALVSLLFFMDLSPSSHMLCSCFVLSFDACIVTITWSLMFVVIAIGRLLSLHIAWVVYQCWCGSSYFIGWQGNNWLYSLMWCPGLNHSVKLHALHGSVVPTRVAVLLGLSNPPRCSCGETAKPELLYPHVWIPFCDRVN